MDKKTKKKIIILVVAIAVIFIGYMIYSNANRNPGKYDAFASCLGEKGAKFYGTNWCTYCQRQKKMFGDSAKLLPYEECSMPGSRSISPICQKVGIKSFPTWRFADGTELVGLQNLEDLAQKTGCEIPQEI